MCWRCSADLEAAAGLATAEAADPDAVVPSAEASPDTVPGPMDAAASGGQLHPVPLDSAVSSGAAPAVGPGPGLAPAAADDAGFEGILEPESSARAAGGAEAAAESQALSLGERTLLATIGCSDPIGRQQPRWQARCC